MINALLGKTKTVADVLSSFSSTIADLKTIVQNQANQITANANTIAALEAANKSAEEEQAKAAKIAAKLEELIS